MDCEGITCAWADRRAQSKKEGKSGIRTMKGESELKRDDENVQSANGRIRRGERPIPHCGIQPRTSEAVSHLYVHIPFCARIARRPSGFAGHSCAKSKT